MSKIDAQIKELLDKKAKIALLNAVLASTKNYDKDEYKNVKDDVVKMLSEFVTAKITEIEDGRVTNKLTEKLSDDDIAVVKSLVDKVKNKNVKTEVVENKKQPQQPLTVDTESVSAKLDFALANQHLAGARVKVAGQDGKDINGIVQGLDCPFVLVSVETGQLIKVPPNKLTKVK